MGFVRKKASQINSVRKSVTKEVGRGASSVNAQRKRTHSQIAAEARRTADDPWKVAALVAAPFALPALISMGATAAQGGFMQAVAGSVKSVGGKFVKSQLIGKIKEQFSGLSDGMREKMGDPGYLADMMIKAGSHLAGAKLAGTGMSDEEELVFRQMSADLDTIRKQDQAAYDEQLGLADEVINQARQTDAEQVGLKAQRDVQNAGAAQVRTLEKDAALKEGGRGLSVFEKRRAGLDIARKGQSAYLEGRETGEDIKTKGLQAGAGLKPRNAPTAAFEGGKALLDQHQRIDERRKQTASNTGKFIEDTVRGGASMSTGQGKAGDSIVDKGKDIIKKKVEDKVVSAGLSMIGLG